MSRCLLVVAALLIPATSGCSFPTPSEQFACSTNEDCDGARLCRSGWCVIATVDCDGLSDGERCNTDLCLENQSCSGGECQGGVPIACSDEDPCTEDICDPATGGCSFPQEAESSRCDDGDPCTAHDECAGGVCRGIQTCGCAGDCSSCSAACCAEKCADDCPIACSSSECACNFDCSDGARCTGGCGGDSLCNIDCGSDGRCDLSCSGTSDCDVDCIGGDQCSVSCLDSARCLLRCGAGASCEPGECAAGGWMSCAGQDVAVCNRPCP